MKMTGSSYTYHKEPIKPHKTIPNPKSSTLILPLPISPLLFPEYPFPKSIKNLN